MEMWSHLSLGTYPPGGLWDALIRSIGVIGGSCFLRKAAEESGIDGVSESNLKNSSGFVREPRSRNADV
jgi:hypothetical protein